MKIKERYVDEKVVAEIIGCSVQTLRNKRCKAKKEKDVNPLTYVKCGRMVRYFLPDVYVFMESRKIIRDQ